MSATHETDATVIGAGPAGLFAVFQLGLAGLRAQVVEELDRPGGQLTQLYPDKPVYDMPGFRVIDGQPLADRLMAQIGPFDTRFHWGRRAQALAPEGALWRVTLDDGSALLSRVVVLATGLGIPGAGQPVAPPPGAGAQFQPRRGLVPVGTADFGAGRPGLFAIGDGCTYPGKIKLLVPAFHEAVLMAQAAFAHCHPETRPKTQYTSASPTLQRRLGV